MVNVWQFILSASGIASLVIIGLLALIGTFRKEKKNEQAEAQQSSEYLIGVLQGTVNELKEKVTNQTSALNEAEKKINTLETENRFFREVFQGRDKTMQKFMEQGFATMAVVPELIKITKSTNDLIQQLAKQQMQTTVTTTEKKIVSPMATA